MSKWTDGIDYFWTQAGLALMILASNAQEIANALRGCNQ
jgi:hypothetical protein